MGALVGNSGVGLPPLLDIGAAARYQYSSSFESTFKVVTRFGDPINLSKVTLHKGVKYLLTPRALAEGEYADIREEGARYKFHSLVSPCTEEQHRLLEEAGDLLRLGKSFILEAPTGSGKTVVALDLVARVGRRTIVFVTKEDLKEQWIESAKKFLGLQNSQIGIIQGASMEVAGKPFVIAMVQSASRVDKYPDSVFSGFGLCIFDEVHRFAADTFSEVCWKVPAKLRLGLSASPNRRDGRDIVLLGHIGPVLVRGRQFRLTPKVIVVQSGWKVPMVVRTIDGVKKVVSLPHTAGKLGQVVKLLARDKSRNNLIGRFVYDSYKKGRKCVVFSDSRSHLEELFTVLYDFGINSSDMGFYVGGMKKHEREATKKKHILLATYGFCAEATDISSLDTLVLGTPRANVLQPVGRILRKHDGKQFPVVLDIVDGNSKVLRGYASSRLKWYYEIGSEVKFLDK